MLHIDVPVFTVTVTGNCTWGNGKGDCWLYIRPVLVLHY